jgi:mxaJ protein
MRSRFPRALRFAAAALLAPLFLVLPPGCRRDRPPRPQIEAATSQRIQAPSPPIERLRVCADPNNLPFSNAAGEGFENRIASLLGERLGVPVEYTWWAQRRGFVRSTLKEGLCDVVIGVPTALDMLATSAPYYRSIYVFVTRRDRGLAIRSFDDPRLHELRVGVQIIGDDGTNSPPAHALSRRGVIANVVGFPVYGDYSKPNPAARIVDAVASGEVDVAVVWGPLAGYFARNAAVPLDLVPVSPEIDQPFLPFAFDMSIGVRRGEDDFKRRLEAIMARERPRIDAILAEYGVPRADERFAMQQPVHAPAHQSDGEAHAVRGDAS